MVFIGLVVLHDVLLRGEHRLSVATSLGSSLDDRLGAEPLALDVAILVRGIIVHGGSRTAMKVHVNWIVRWLHTHIHRVSSGELVMRMG